MEEEEKPRILQVAGKLCGWMVRETLQHPDELNSAAGNVAFFVLVGFALRSPLGITEQQWNRARSLD